MPSSLQPLPAVTDPWDEPLGWRQRYPLWGRGLRFLLLAELMARPTMTVAELVEALERHGYPVAGRPSKVVSDALRQELNRGRVTRHGRGVYRYRRETSVTTERRIRVLSQRSRAWAAARCEGRSPPPVPRDPRAHPHRTYDPEAPPWTHLGWLWTK